MRGIRCRKRGTGFPPGGGTTSSKTRIKTWSQERVYGDAGVSRRGFLRAMGAGGALLVAGDRLEDGRWDAYGLAGGKAENRGDTSPPVNTSSQGNLTRTPTPREDNTTPAGDTSPTGNDTSSPETTPAPGNTTAGSKKSAVTDEELYTVTLEGPGRRATL